MDEELKPVNDHLTTEKFIIVSLEKLDNNYIHIIGEKDFKHARIDFITNGIFTFDFSSFSKVREIISYNGNDYLIAENIYNESFLISLKDGVKIIKNVKGIKYITDGLFGISEKKQFYIERVFDLTTNDYIPFPDNMIFANYKDDILTLQESNKESYEKHQEMVIDRRGNIILPKFDSRIHIINKTKFISEDKIIDLNQKVIIQDADLIMPFGEEKIIILKNRKLFILNNTLEVIKTYLIGETKKPCYFSVNGDDCITMTFKKKIRTKKYEPRKEKDITIIVNTRTDTISKVDFIPSLSIYNIFTIKSQNHKQGLMNKKGEIILSTEYDNIKALHDINNKYFFLEKDDEHYIFNAETKIMKKVLYTKMEEYRDGLTIGYIPEPRSYQLIDEELNIIFNLEHMGHTKYFFNNGILCYHSGSWINQYDAYTIITQSGEILMPSRECQIKRNKFGLLEIEDKQTGKKNLFNMDKEQFVKLEINVPIIKNELGKKYDLSSLSIQQDLLNSQHSLLLEENLEKSKKLLLKPKGNENL